MQYVVEIDKLDDSLEASYVARKRGEVGGTYRSEHPMVFRNQSVASKVRRKWNRQTGTIATERPYDALIHPNVVFEKVVELDPYRFVKTEKQMEKIK